MTYSKDGENKMAPPLRSVLQQDLTIEGNISGTGILEIDSQLVGDIAVDTVIVAFNGSTAGKIDARNLTVFGTVEGRIEGKSLVLKAQANVRSDAIVSKCLTIEEGAVVNGTVLRA
ncbi:polymer-forming cytoskeletal protein [Shimia sp. FJ5]|uniref:bactofilin family protein n=1 Tax=Shimia sp. FJ5 TaxID=3079054 RepID=UPI00293DC894|nr:polymer-forming cytoskeletal protein [Shimia sp. FJ5]MDV4146717.1 polymer-forming cytoskeletal protein [Shimia sp. FJ5]